MVCRYFFPFHRLSFHFVGGFFPCAEASVFDVFFILLLVLLGVLYEEITSRRFFLSSSRSFMASGRTFKSLIPFKSIFASGVKTGVKFHSSTCEYPIFFNLLKRRSFLQWRFQAPLSNISWLYMLISGLLILFHYSICLFLCLYHCLHDYSFIA